MTPKEIKTRIKKIASGPRGWDDERHRMEDELREDVLNAIASGAENAQELAREVLKTSDLEFGRWYE